MLKKLFVVGGVVLFALSLSAILMHLFASCGPHEICMGAGRCGNKQLLQPPGWVLIAHCGNKQQGDPCTYCDGTNNLRQCTGSGEENDRHCLWGTASCGNKFNGTCAKYLVLLYCKESGSTIGDCGQIAVCTGTAPN